MSILLVFYTVVHVSTLLQKHTFFFTTEAYFVCTSGYFFCTALRRDCAQCLYYSSKLLLYYRSIRWSLLHGHTPSLRRDCAQCLPAAFSTYASARIYISMCIGRFEREYQVALLLQRHSPQTLHNVCQRPPAYESSSSSKPSKIMPIINHERNQLSFWHFSYTTGYSSPCGNTTAYSGAAYMYQHMHQRVCLRPPRGTW